MSDALIDLVPVASSAIEEKVRRFEKLGFSDRLSALAAVMQRLGHRDVVEAWGIGRILRSLIAELPRGRGNTDRTDMLARLGIAKRTAERYIQLANGYENPADLADFSSVDAALNALKKPEPEPAPTVDQQPDDPPAREPDEVLDSATARPVVGVESPPPDPDIGDPDDLLDDEERESMRVEHVPESDPERGWKLYRETLQESQGKTQEINRLKRFRRDVEAYWLAVEGENPARDEFLARFFGVARKS